MQNLIVRVVVPAGRKRKPTGRYGVVAGGRRLAALQWLHAQGRIAADYPVRCLLVSDDEAIAVSTAENSGREALHGADLFDAFLAMREQGRTPEQIADAWGLSTLAVQRRLKLANVSPRLLALYREDEINLDQLMALAVTDDHDAQESAWESAPAYDRSPHALRRRLTASCVASTAPLARFVGQDDFVAAGGSVHRDLFSDDDSAYWNDPALLERLAIEKLQPQAEALQAEGFAWVDVRPCLTYSDLYAFSRCRTVEREPSAEEKERFDTLHAEIEAIDERIEALGESEDCDAETLHALQEQARDLHAQAEALRDSLALPHPAEQRLAGALVYLDSEGRLAVHRGLVRPEDRNALHRIRDANDANAPDADAQDTQETEAKPEPARTGFSEKLMRGLTAQRTAALRAEVAERPLLALRILAFKLAADTLPGRSFWKEYGLTLTAQPKALEHEGIAVGSSDAHTRCSQSLLNWSQQLPEEAHALLDWCLHCDEQDLQQLIAVCVAACLYDVRGNGNTKLAFEAAAAAIPLDMRRWWSPTHDNYLGHITKAQIAQALTEAGCPTEAARVASLKKVDAITLAQPLLAERRWLPRPLRDDPA